MPPVTRGNRKPAGFWKGSTSNRKPRAKARKSVFRTTTRASAGRNVGVIRPQNRVPLQSVIALRYKTSYQTVSIPSEAKGSNPNGKSSGAQLNINMSDPIHTNCVSETTGASLPTWQYLKSNGAAAYPPGDDNLMQEINATDMLTKYNHFYVRKSKVTVIVRALPNQVAVGQRFFNIPGQGNQYAGGAASSWQSNFPPYTSVSPPALDADLYNIAVMSDRQSINLVDKTVHDCRYNLAGVSLKRMVSYPHSNGRECKFTATYTPRRLGIKDPGDARDQIGFTAQTPCAENTFYQLCLGKQNFPMGQQSANMEIQIAVDYEIVCMERQITDNTPQAVPVQHTGEL